MRLRHFIYYLLYVAAVVALSVFIILAFHPSLGEKNKGSSGHKSGTPSVSHNSSKGGAIAGGGAAPSGSSSSSSPSSSSNSSSASNTSGSASSTPTGQGSSSGLTNTGPGDTAALFVVVAAVSGLGYRYYLLKKTGA